jgi:hypothetical protein
MRLRTSFGRQKATGTLLIDCRICKEYWDATALDGAFVEKSCTMLATGGAGMDPPPGEPGVALVLVPCASSPD